MRSPVINKRSDAPCVLYHHQPCFDGLISAAVAQDYLETVRGWRNIVTEPITYRNDRSWIEMDLGGNSAVVDYLYHPQAKFWLDHHVTTFLDTDLQSHYESSMSDPKRTLVYDSKAPSGALLLWNHIEHHVSDPERYADMVKWANITDSAGYESPEQAVYGDEPALRIAQTLGSSIDRDRLGSLLGLLRNQTLEEVAASPLVSVPYDSLRSKIDAGLQTLQQNLHVHSDGVATYEISTSDLETIPRFGAFLLNRDIRYLVSCVSSDRGTKISATRNPWGPPTNAELGLIFRGHGGGGHHGVGSIHLPVGQESGAKRIFDSVLMSIRSVEKSIEIQRNKIGNLSTPSLSR